MGPEAVMRVVVDTHTVMAALLFGGAPAKLIPLWKAGRIKPYASREIVAEYLKVMAYPAFNLTEREMEYLLYRELLPSFEVAPVRPPKKSAQRAVSNDKFIRCARAADARPIISGDRRLLALKSYDRIPILTASEFLEQAQKRIKTEKNVITNG